MSFFIESHFERDIQAIETTEVDRGWHGEFRIQRPDLFSTYHFIQISYKLGLRTPNQVLTDDIHAALNDRFTDCEYRTISTDAEISLLDFVHAIGILAVTESSTPIEIEIQNELNQFVSSSGLYRFSHSRNAESEDKGGKLLATYFATTLASTVKNLHVPEDTASRVQNRWQQRAPEIESLGEAAILVSTLAELGQEPTCLRQYSNWRQVVVDRINEVLGSRNHLPTPILEHIDLILEYTDIQPDDLNHHFGERLADAQLPDGGINFLDNDFSDPHGTAVYASMVSRFDADIDDEAIKRFVESHWLPTGGFLSTVSREPKLEATYYAQETLKYFDKQQRHRTWIPETIEEDIDAVINGFESLYKLVSLLSDELAMLSPPELRHHLRSYAQSDECCPREAYYAVRLAKEVGLSIDDETKRAIIQSITELSNSNGSYGGQPTQETAFYATRTLDTMGEFAAVDRELVSWLEQTRTDCSGFAARRGKDIRSQADLLSTYYSVGTLDLFESAWKESEGLLEFVLDCRLANGGFCVVPGDERSLFATYCGIKTLEMLSQDGTVDQGDLDNTWNN